MTQGKKPTNVAFWISKRDNLPYVVWVYDSLQMREDQPMRERLKNEKDCEDPYLQFVNARNLWEMLGALEQFDKALVSPYVNGDRESYRSAVDDAKAIAEMFEPNPSRNTIARTKETAAIWQENGPYECDMLMPLSECIRASRDIRSALRVLAFLNGECSLEFAKEAFRDPPSFATTYYFGTKKFEEEYPLLSSHYEKLAGPTEIFCIFPNMFHPVTKEFDERWIAEDGSIQEEVLRELNVFAAEAFNMNMFGTSPRFAPVTKGHRWKYTTEIEMFSEYSLSDIWTYVAEKFSEGKLSICDYCGKAYIRQRNTKRTCSRSCTQGLGERRRKEQAKDTTPVQ